MFLIHQMGKVGSTAILHALQKGQLDVLQTHSLSKKNLYANIDAFLQPNMDINRIKQEKELFFSQVIATKAVLDSKINSDKHLKIITLTRDPFDRWISALTQNYQFHTQSAKEFYLLQTGKEVEDDFTCLDYAFSQLMLILQLETLVAFRKKWDKEQRTFWEKLLGKIHPHYKAYLPPIEDKIYRLGSAELHGYFWEVDHFSNEQANLLIRKLGAELLMPFYWFETNLYELVDIDIYEHPIKEGISTVSHKNIELLFMKFETLKSEPQKCEEIISTFTGTSIKLERVNVSKGKAGFEIMQQIKEKYAPIFKQLEAIQLSQYCQHFNYI